MYFIDGAVGKRLRVRTIIAFVMDVLGYDRADLNKLEEKFEIDLSLVDNLDDELTFSPMDSNGQLCGETITVTKSLACLILYIRKINNKSWVMIEDIIAALNTATATFGADNNFKDIIDSIVDGEKYTPETMKQQVPLISDPLFEAMMDAIAKLDEVHDSLDSLDLADEEEQVEQEEASEPVIVSVEGPNNMEKVLAELDNKAAQFCSDTANICSQADIDKIEDAIMTAVVGDYRHIVVRSSNQVVGNTAVIRAMYKMIGERIPCNTFFMQGARVLVGFGEKYVDASNIGSIILDDASNNCNIIIVQPVESSRNNVALIENINFNRPVKARIDVVSEHAGCSKNCVVIDLNETTENRVAAFKYRPEQFVDSTLCDIDDKAVSAVGSQIKSGRKDSDIKKLLIEAYKSAMRERRKSVTENDIANALKRLEWHKKKDKYAVIKELKTTLAKQIKGQDAALDAICRAMKIASVGLNDENKPIVSMMFVGPTGTGKTETAIQLAKALDRKFIRVDMSEYADETAVNKINGSSAGYVGYEDGSVFGKLITGNEKCVLLLDEVEKAHPKVFDTLLQILDNGVLHDNKGSDINFRKAIIIMTSNSGIQDMGKRGVGFNSAEEVDVKNNKGISECVDAALRRNFRGEFINRIDYIIQFNQIDRLIAREIAVKMMGELTSKLKNETVVRDTCYDMLADKGIDIKYGAREIKRFINDEIKSAIAEAIIDNSINKKSVIYIDYVNGQVDISFGNKKERASK